MGACVQPIVFGFLEEVKEYGQPEISYSEQEQRSVRSSGDLANPIFMSPTSMSTSNSDSCGDEAH